MKILTSDTKKLDITPADQTIRLRQSHVMRNVQTVQMKRMIPMYVKEIKHFEMAERPIT